LADIEDMNVALAAAFAAPGLAVGSFLNVVASRLPLRRSLVHPPSACMSCGTQIAPRDNVPLVSWLLLRGRCRLCRVRIPARYPLVELVTALLVAACGLRFGASAEAFLAAGFCVVLVALAVIDLEHRIVPNRIVLPALALGMLGRLALEPSVEWPLAALGASGFLLAAALAYPRGLGMGDVKLAALLGAVLGGSVAVALMIGMATALLPAAIIAMREGVSAARTTALPLVPFLALGSVISLFAGDELLRSYVALFG
jgi:leader peptidase (prepilin peptidase)/N-methyltransferase